MALSKLATLFETWLAKHPFLYRILKKVKVFCQRLIYFIFKLFGQDKDLIYNNSFFEQNLKTNLPVARDFVDVLDKYFHPRSVVDIGCGTAEYLAEFQKKGVKIKGYEGSGSALKQAKVGLQYIEKADLRNVINSEQRYDLALCLEVAEHIESRYSKNLLDTLTNLSDTVIFTAAAPGQGGHFHINEQPKDFWMALWQERNYIYQDVAVQNLKEAMLKKNVLRWYLDNLMVFQMKPRLMER